MGENPLCPDESDDSRIAIVRVRYNIPNPYYFSALITIYHNRKTCQGLSIVHALDSFFIMI